MVGDWTAADPKPTAYEQTHNPYAQWFRSDRCYFTETINFRFRSKIYRNIVVSNAYG